jgi:hypothetical protein
MPQRFSTDDEVRDAKAAIGWRFWANPILSSLACLGAGLFAFSGDQLGIWLLMFFGAVAIVLWTGRLRQYEKFTADIESRTLEVLEGAPQRVWLTGRGADCYLQMAGHTIKVPSECYGDLKEANIVRVAFLPTSHIAVSVEAGRGIRLS